MRADIVMARTATALAAWAGRTDVLAEDVRQAALLALPHRRRRNPFDAPGLDEDKLDDTLEEFGGQDDGARRPDGDDDGRIRTGPAGVAGSRRRTGPTAAADGAARPAGDVPAQGEPAESRAQAPPGRAAASRRPYGPPSRSGRRC